jgi:hypothetical protein
MATVKSKVQNCRKEGIMELRLWFARLEFLY